MQITDRARVTGWTAAGAFYGTRTVLQRLATGRTLPAGRAVDVPRYAQRTVGVRACYTYYPVAWLDRLIRDMAYLKLNYLHLELRSKTHIQNYPQFQLRSKDGMADPTRLDLTKPAAFTFYTNPVNRDLKLFPGRTGTWAPMNT